MQDLNTETLQAFNLHILECLPTTIFVDESEMRAFIHIDELADLEVNLELLRFDEFYGFHAFNLSVVNEESLYQYVLNLK